MNSLLSFAEMLGHHPGQSASGLADKALRQACALLEADAGMLYLMRQGPDGEYLVHAGSFPAGDQPGTGIPSNLHGIATMVAQTDST